MPETSRDWRREAAAASRNEPNRPSLGQGNIRVGGGVGGDGRADAVGVVRLTVCRTSGKLR
ncbi:MAG: hypothetical protein N2039_10430 [Gemmataceae bacterium]|nr:hypothetical protein [Gemmataceae bacterium]